MGPKRDRKKDPKKVLRDPSFLQNMGPKKERKRDKGTKSKSTATKAKRKPTTKKVLSKDPTFFQNMGTKKKKKKDQVTKRGRKKKLPKGEQRAKKIFKKPKQVKKSSQKKQKPLMWEAYHIPEMEKLVLDWEHKWEQSLGSNRFHSSFFNDQDNCIEMKFIEKIYHLENELYLKGEKYRNGNDWIKELYEVCQKEIKQTKETLNKIYELKNYCKPISNKEDSATGFDQELHTFGLNPVLWIGGQNETAPPGCGSVPYPSIPKKVSKKADISEGQYVAAYVILDQKMVELPDRGERFFTKRGFIQLDPDTGFPNNADLKCDGSWILARCIRPPEGKRKDYIIADVDYADEMDVDDSCLPGYKILGKALPHFRIPRKALIPLPLYLVDPEFNPEAIFPVGADVLALYKETTSFFPAVVEETPKSITDLYKLRFKDENQNIQNQVYFVLQKYVIEYRDVGKIFSQKEIAQLMYMKKIES